MRLPRRVRFLPGLVEGGPAFQRLAGRLQLRVALVEVVDRAEVRLRVGRGLRVDERGAERDLHHAATFGDRLGQPVADVALEVRGEGAEGRGTGDHRDRAKLDSAGPGVNGRGGTAAHYEQTVTLGPHRLSKRCKGGTPRADSMGGR